MAQNGQKSTKKLTYFSYKIGLEIGHKKSKIPHCDSVVKTVTSAFSLSDPLDKKEP